MLLQLAVELMIFITGVNCVFIAWADLIPATLIATHHDLTIPGKYSLLFAAPEAVIGMPEWRDLLLSAPLYDRVVAVAVDEAHCVSKW